MSTLAWHVDMVFHLTCDLSILALAVSCIVHGFRQDDHDTQWLGAALLTVSVFLLASHFQ